MTDFNLVELEFRETIAAREERNDIARGHEE